MTKYTNAHIELVAAHLVGCSYCKTIFQLALSISDMHRNVVIKDKKKRGKK